jgi:hypothetical protein
MGEPYYLTPCQIDGFTLNQILLYFQETQKQQMSYQELCQRVDEIRKAKGIPTTGK